MINITVYDSVDGALARSIRERLSAAPKQPVEVRLHSPGGSLLDGLAIYHALKSHEGRVVTIVEGCAASAASLIAMAGDERLVGESSYLLIHNPSMTADGDATALHEAGEFVDRMTNQLADVYATRAKIDREQIVALMTAESWLNAGEAIAMGLADRIVGARRVAASWRAGDYFTNPPSPITESDSMSATASELKTALPKAPAEFILSQVLAEATIDQARAAWLDHREKQLDQRERQAPGCDGLSDTGRVSNQSDSDPSEFTRLIDEQIAAGRSRIDAVSLVGRKHPDLHAAFVASRNSTSPRIQGLIAERFAQ